MTLAELYPYWGDTHSELLEALAPLSDDALDFKPMGGVPSVRQLALSLLQSEREWIARLVAGFEIETVLARQYPDGARLAEVLAAQRSVTARVLEPLSAAGLRAVRTVPADTVPHHPEANRTIGWLFWHLLERELMVWGQIQARLDEQRAARKHAR